MVKLMQNRSWTAAAALVGVFSFVSACAAAPKQPVAAAETGAAPQSSPDFSDKLVPIYASDRYAGCELAPPAVDENGVRIVNYGERLVFNITR